MLASNYDASPVVSQRFSQKLDQDTTCCWDRCEAQFFDSEVANVAQELATRGVRVIVAGLDMDSRGEPFVTHAFDFGKSRTRG